MTAETKWSLEEEIFDPPSGSVRGVIVGYLGEGKRRKRVAHAYLLTEGSADISVYSYKSSTVEDIQAYSALLASFSARIQNTVVE